MLRSFSEKVTKLNTELVLVVEVSEAIFVLVHFSLFLVAHEVHVIVVLNVEIKPVDNKSSCIFAIVSAGVVAPDIPSSSLVSGKIRSVSKVRMFAISWLALLLHLMSWHPTRHPLSILLLHL